MRVCTCGNEIGCMSAHRLCPECRGVYGRYAKPRPESNRQFVRRLKAGGRCTNCLETDPRCLDFHHVKPETKRFTIHEVVRNTSIRRGRLLAELAKCILLCSNCHRKHHGKQYDPVAV